MKFKKTLLFGLLALGCFTASAQEATTAYDFNPHWYVQGQFGGQYTLGEVGFMDLLSPNAQLGVGYNFSPVLGVRLSANAWESKAGSHILYNNQFVQNYKWSWNYVAPSLDLTANLTNLFGGFCPKRVVNVGIFAGVGANIAMNNGEAATANDQLKALHTYASGYNPLYYLWDGTKTSFVGRAGVNFDFRITDAVSVGAEFQANTLSDKYNSKRAYNTDWYFNALVGVKINLGKTYTERVVVAPEPEVRYVEKVVEKIVEKPVTVTEVRREPLRRDIFFTINSTVISKAESVKVQDVADYLNKYADAKVVISGYADAGTGNDKINDRLAAQRADRVKKALVEKYGIAESRITYDSHGSRVQPFQQNDMNRVSICIAE